LATSLETTLIAQQVSPISLGCLYLPRSRSNKAITTHRYRFKLKLFTFKNYPNLIKLLSLSLQNNPSKKMRGKEAILLTICHFQTE